jgi:uncharacterized protein
VAENPFRYGSPVSGQHFTGRQAELAALVSRMTNSINVVLVSPRRYGKTSLLLASERRLRAQSKAAALVSVNVLRCADLASLAGRLAHAAYAMPGGRWHRARQSLGDFVRRLRVTPTVAFLPDGNPRFGFDASMGPTDAETVISDVYQLLAEQAERGPAALILDEFQAVADLSGHLSDLFKSLADTWPRVSLVVAGSKRHLMARLVDDRAAPLYGMAERIALGPIPAPEMIAYVQARAAETGKRAVAGAAEEILDRAGPVPNDIQRLAYEAWDAAVEHLDDAAVDMGMARVLEHDSLVLAERFERLAPGQRRVLVALANDAGPSVYASAFARRTGMATPAGVRKAIQALEADELVAMRDGRPVVADPFLRAWLSDQRASNGE